MSNELLCQQLVDNFNRAYWKATHTDHPGDYIQACLLARQMVVELGRENIVHDRLMDSEYPNKHTLEK